MTLYSPTVAYPKACPDEMANISIKMAHVAVTKHGSEWVTKAKSYIADNHDDSNIFIMGYYISHA